MKTQSDFTNIVIKQQKALATSYILRETINDITASILYQMDLKDNKYQRNFQIELKILETIIDKSVSSLQNILDALQDRNGKNIHNFKYEEDPFKKIGNLHCRKEIQRRLMTGLENQLLGNQLSNIQQLIIEDWKCGNPKSTHKNPQEIEQDLLVQEPLPKLRYQILRLSHIEDELQYFNAKKNAIEKTHEMRRGYYDDYEGITQLIDKYDIFHTQNIFNVPLSYQENIQMIKELQSKRSQEIQSQLLADQGFRTKLQKKDVQQQTHRYLEKEESKKCAECYNLINLDPCSVLINYSKEVLLAVAKWKGEVEDKQIQHMYSSNHYLSGQKSKSITDEIFGQKSKILDFSLKTQHQVYERGIKILNKIDDKSTKVENQFQMLSTQLKNVFNELLNIKEKQQEIDSIKKELKDLKIIQNQQVSRRISDDLNFTDQVNISRINPGIYETGNNSEESFRQNQVIQNIENMHDSSEEQQIISQSKIEMSGSYDFR